MLEIFQAVWGLLSGDIGKWLAAGVGVLAALFAARRSGRLAAERKVAKERLEDNAASGRVDRETDAMSDDKLEEEAKKWTR
jgi:hypothetical protein